MASTFGRFLSAGRSFAVPMWMIPATFSPSETPSKARAPTL